MSFDIDEAGRVAMLVVHAVNKPESTELRYQQNQRYRRQGEDRSMLDQREHLWRPHMVCPASYEYSERFLRVVLKAEAAVELSTVSHRSGISEVERMIEAHSITADAKTA